MTSTSRRLLLIFTLLSGLAPGALAAACERVVVREGVADLRCWDGRADIALSGDWQLRYQSRDTKVGYEGLAKVPMRWKDFSPPLPFLGRGVYSVKLLLPQPMDHMGLWLSMSSKARKVFVVDADGSQALVFDSGNTNLNGRSIARMQIAPIDLPKLGTSSQLIIVLNNSESITGGISDAIVIGPIAKMWRPIQLLKNTSLIIATLLLVFAIINITFWLAKKRDWALLLMAVLALILALRSLAISGLLYDFFPSLNSRDDALIGWGTYLGGTIVGALYYRYSYPLLIPRWLPVLIGVFTLVGIFLLSFQPIYVLQAFGYYYRFLTMVLGMLLIVMLIKGVKTSGSELKVTLLSSMVLIVSVVADEAYYYLLGSVAAVSLSSLGVLFFVGVLTALISRRYSRSLIQRAKLSRQLKILNAQLEQKVVERTAELAIKNQQLENISRTDPLTKIANRRAFDEIIHAEAARNKRSDLAMVIAIIDLDYFKRVNDAFGHNAGDEILIATAKVLVGAARTGDFVARWGGEEFAMVLPETDLAAARSVAERLRKAISNQQFNFGDKTMAVTASFGLAVCGPSQSVAEAIKQADEALYRAKAEGRDRVCLYR